MPETIAHQAFDSVRSEAFLAMSPKARLDTFAWAYCCAISEASEAEIQNEAGELAVPEEQLRALRDMRECEQARIVAEVLRIFCDRQPGTEASPFDTLLDDVMGVGGFDGTIPG